jgi:hypothetical protein
MAAKRRPTAATRVGQSGLAEVVAAISTAPPAYQ